MNRYCKICWIILVLFFFGNVIILGVWYYKHMGWHHDEGRKFSKEQFEQRFKMHLENEVGMDSIQYINVKSIQINHFKQLESLNFEIDSIKKLIMEITFSNEHDSLKIANYSGQIAEKQMEMEIANYDHYKSMRDICNSEIQKGKLDSLFISFIEKHRTKYKRN